ncbi:MAG: copper-binding protein [Pseudomonadota bacterium]|nr:copper-binding protein [Sphingomonas sp.]MDQ3471835.1 copper-binding protein [Pseudomonadota bacterium]
MKISQLASAVPLALLLAACGDNQAAAPEQRETSAGTAAPTGAADIYSATGDVTKVSGDQVTISHGPVEGIGWPAMTMAFQAPSPQLLQGLNVGDPVDFQFRQAGEQYLLTSIKKAQR